MSDRFLLAPSAREEEAVPRAEASARSPSVASETYRSALRLALELPSRRYGSHLSAHPAPARAKVAAPSLVRTRHVAVPGLADDYYDNPLACNQESILAIALGTEVWLWDGSDRAAVLLLRAGARVCALAWTSQGKSSLLVGLENGTLELWDPLASARLRSWRAHSKRVCVIEARGGAVYSGGYDSAVRISDLRRSDAAGSALRGHLQQVCGLAMSGCSQYLASGGNDNLLLLWDVRRFLAVQRMQGHTGAVRALAFDTIASRRLFSGGGRADTTMRLWDTTSGQCLRCAVTGGQVCALLHRPAGQEGILAALGHGSGGLTVWSSQLKPLTRVDDADPHTRVVHMVRSPDGAVVASGAADQTISLWSSAQPSFSSAFQGGRVSIR